MSQPPPFPSEIYHTRESVALFDDTGAQQYFAIDGYKAIGEYKSKHWLNEGPYHTGLLQDVIRLARRLVYSEVGRSVFDRTPLSERVATLEEFEKSPLMTLIVTNRIQEPTQIRAAQAPRLPEIRLRFDLVNSAAQAHYWASQPGARPEALNKRNRQIFYLAVLIEHEMQEVMHLSRTDQGEGPFRIVQPGRWGMDLERELVGGVVIGFRIPPVQKETPLSVRFPYGQSGLTPSLLKFGEGSRNPWGRIVPPGETVDISPTELGGISVKMKQDGVQGYYIVKDEIIKRIIEGQEGWEQYLPLNAKDHSEAGFIEGKHPDGIVREDERARQRRLDADRRCGTHAWKPSGVPLKSRLVAQCSATPIIEAPSAGEK